MKLISEISARRQRRVLSTALLAAVLLVGGCLGKTPPVEQYLNVLPEQAGCDNRGKAGQRKDIVAVKLFKSVDALDRQAVLLAKGRVQSQSLSWYWEAVPGQLVSQAVIRRLGCSDLVTPVWPVRSATKADKVLTGLVTAMSVDLEGKAVQVKVQLQLWDGQETSVVAMREFSAETALVRLDAQGVAEATAASLGALGAEVRTWLEAAPK